MWLPRVPPLRTARQRWFVTAEDHSFRRRLTQTESGGESVRHSRGAYDARGNTTSAFWGRKATVQHPTSNCAVGLRHSGGAWPCLWRTEFSSVKKGRFSEDLSAFRGRTLGIPGAHNPICTCTTPVVDCPLFVEMWEIRREEPRRLRQGESLRKAERVHR